ncbi:EF-hand domain-containing family member B [Mytilus coruscus]|uniref:EF-hand domain-containing family member B n=1 Tax=Mytilus coruscus TaxID=42192 RepID=A0A6J8E3S9_MYTCO|nr:EF-hand domain-containing family member B [Mytilus coruscus]
MSSETQVRLPSLNGGIYTGKFKDWSPTVRPAGKLTVSGDTAELCMKPKNDRPPSADIIINPDGQMRVFYGRAQDPHLQWAAEMTHGINTTSSNTAGELANPPPKTLFNQRKLDRKENIYASHIRAPLGISHEQSHGLPKGLNRDQFTFGIPTELDIGAGGLINPNKTYAEVEAESAVGMELYRETHKNFDVGEKLHRGYTSPSFYPEKKFGIPTPHNNEGIKVKKTLKWMHETEQEKATKLVSKRVDDFRERSQPQLGAVHDPIKDTLKVGPDHTYGILAKPDEYGAGDLMHGRAPADYLRGKDRQRGVLAAIRQHLKKANFHNFTDLVHAFRYYDKDGKGVIDINDLREVCIQYHLPLEPELLEQLLDSCDSNRDGAIDYVEFSNFLNWKDKMKSGLPDKPGTPLNSSRSKSAVSDDLVRKSVHSAESTPRRLKLQIDRAIGDHRTSANMINAVVGGVSTRDYRTYGVPTIRTDIHAPRIRRVDDNKNYGDESDAYGLVNPSIFSRRHVYEKDFLLPRSKEQLKAIFHNIGVQMTGEMFDQVYNMAAKQNPKGHVSVESIRGVIDDIQAHQVMTGQHPMAV